MFYKCTNCEKLRPDDGRKCPHCGANFRGSVGGGKHVVEPRDLKGLKHLRCEHGILPDRPCLKCFRSDEECKHHETRVLMFLKDALIKSGVVSSTQAWDAAKLLRAQID